MKQLMVSVLIILGILLLVCSGVYALNPANHLPFFFPGYAANLTKHHYTHAAACLGLGIVAFIIAWFKSGKKSPQKEQA